MACFLDAFDRVNHVLFKLLMDTFLAQSALFVLVVQRPRTIASIPGCSQLPRTSCSLELQYIGNLRSYINGVRQGGVLSPRIY